MGLWDEVTKIFKEKSVAFLSHKMVLFGVSGINLTFDEMPEFKVIKEQFEEQYECLVYYGVLTTTEHGQYLSLCMFLIMKRSGKMTEGNSRMVTHLPMYGIEKMSSESSALFK